MKNSPWAKLTTFMTPKTNDSPAASSAHIPPVTTALISVKGPEKTTDSTATASAIKIVTPAAEVVRARNRSVNPPCLPAACAINLSPISSQSSHGRWPQMPR